MISILYKNGGQIPHADDKLCDDLLLEAAFSAIEPDMARRRVFLAVLTHPLTDASEIAYRAEILHDFCAVQNLAESMRTELDRLTRLYDSSQRERSRAFTLAKSADSESAISSARDLLMISADTAIKALDILTQLKTVLGMYMPHSDGLRKLRDRLTDFAKLHENADFSDLCQKLTDYGYAAELGPDVRFDISEDGRIGTCELTGFHTLPSAQNEKPSMLKRLLAVKQAAVQDASVKVNDPFGKVRNSLLAPAIGRCTELLDTLTREIFDNFTPLARELLFYETAMQYVQKVKEKRVPLTTPEIADVNEVNELYDLLLCTERMSVADVVPNELTLGAGASVILTGANNSGKTVYLRSVGCAQLLFQAGLPIPAKAAKMRIFTAVRSGYAASEKEFNSGNQAGRFEQEVREMAALLDSLEPDSLLFLNEIFQSTAYSEGAEGLFHILRYLMQLGTGFILVTHLRELLPMLGDSVIHMQTKSGYQVGLADE